MHDVVNYGAGTVNGVVGGIEAPVAWGESKLSSAFAGFCANIGDTACELSAAQGASNTQQMITRPFDIGDTSSPGYKLGFYTGPILLSAMLGVRGILAREAEALASEDVGFSTRGFAPAPGTRIRPAGIPTAGG